MARDRVVLVEDDERCAAACAATLARSGFAVTAYASAREALAACGDFPAGQLVLMDLELPGESSFAAITDLRARVCDVQIVAWTAHAGDEYVFGALRAGAVGYLLKHDPVSSLADALTLVAQGGAPMSPGVARRVLGAFSNPPVEVPDESSSPLTTREHEVVTLLARGCSYGDTSRVLGISLDTVRTHVRHCYDKLHAASKGEAVAEAFRRGLVR